MTDANHFFLIFDGDIRSFKGNPMKTETPFGTPFACGVGNLMEENEMLRETLEKIRHGDYGYDRCEIASLHDLIDTALNQ